jgi:hypothetical protein
VLVSSLENVDLLSCLNLGRYMWLYRKYQILIKTVYVRRRLDKAKCAVVPNFIVIYALNYHYIKNPLHIKMTNLVATDRPKIILMIKL